MKNTRLIIIVSISISLLVNIPRIAFLFGNDEIGFASLFNVSLKDTVFRLFSVFGFSFLVLKLNIDWKAFWSGKVRILKAVFLNTVLLIFWLAFFRVSDFIINGVDSTVMNPRVNLFVYFFIMTLLLIVSKTIELNNQRKYDMIEKERLKQQGLENKLEALKNQVNPHFLFNSLNSLSLLVREDQTAAGEFINKLSFLYRYILQSRSTDVVSIKEELKFLNSYIYLIKQRYRNRFEVQIDIDEEYYTRELPSLALQLLVENSVKHNEISEKRPLKVSIFEEDGFIVVKNKRQQRTNPEASTKTGLSNLNARFNLLLKRGIVIENNSEYFIVKLPMI